MVAVLLFIINLKNKAMAKHARKRSKPTRRRRRVGAMSMTASSPLVKLGSIALGYFLGDKINAALAKVTGTIDGKIVAAAEAGLGALLLLKKGKKSVIVTAAGGVLIGAGAKKLLTEFGVISGFRQVPVIGRRNMNGFRQVPVVNGYNTNSSPLSMGGYNPNSSPLSMNGYQRPFHQQVMGSTGGSGSGITNGGTDYMN